MELIELFNDDMSPNWEIFEKTFPDMATSKHSVRWHKEGSPLEHTKLVVNEMIKLMKTLDEDTPSEDFFILLCAAMLHDIGKPSTTYWDEKMQDWCCKSHGEAGERLFRNLFREEKLGLREKVAYMIRYHMLLHNVLDKPIDKHEKLMSQLVHGTVDFKYMLLLCEADMRGSINEENNDVYIQERIKKINALAEIVKNKKSKWNYIDDDTIHVYVMIGTAGSGKTTEANFRKKNFKEEFNKDLEIISRDTIRAELGFCKECEKYLGTDKEEKKVTEVFDNRLKQLCKERKSFIIDNTSLKKRYRKQYIDLCKEYNAAPHYIYVEAPSMEENINRRKGQIKEDVIQRMWGEMDFPTLDECFTLTLIRDHLYDKEIFGHTLNFN